MPNLIVPANAGGMPKFNRSKLMKAAWTIYRCMTRTARPSTVAGRRRWFSDALRGAWEAAKLAAAEAVKTEADRAADRRAELIRQLQTLDARSFRYSIIDERRALVCELSSLETV